MKRQNAAFTLAEVLIVLAIIGVVAAITIPALMQKTQDQEYSVALRKEYSVLMQALMQYKSDNGGDLSGLFPAGQASPYSLNQLLPYLKVSKNCGTGSGCFFSKIKSYKPANDGNGNYSYGYSDIDTSSNTAKAILADGASVGITNAATYFGSSQTCSYEYDTYQKDASGNYVLDNGNKIPQHVTSSICGYLYIDVNGLKGPNQFGIDNFEFDIVSKGISSGSENTKTILSGGSLVR